MQIETNNKHPIAGKTFKGLTIKLRGAGTTINWVKCDAKIADKRLRAEKQSFFAGPHQRKTVICRWRVPPHTGGKRLRLWNYGHGRTFVADISPHTVVSGRQGGTSWIVKKR